MCPCLYVLCIFVTLFYFPLVDFACVFSFIFAGSAVQGIKIFIIIKTLFLLGLLGLRKV